MTAAEMLVKLRTLLDEATQQFWQDDICYSALTDGQTEYVALILNQYKAKTIINSAEPLPEILRTLYYKTELTIAASAVPLPLNFLYDISVYLGGTYNRYLIRRELSKLASFDALNVYMGAKGYYYSLDNSNINLEIPTPAGIACNIEWLQKPTQIIVTTATPAVIVDPILPEYTHLAIVIYAFSQLLKKAKLFEAAALQQKEFTSLIKYI